jgi:putative ABC transport system substrate-binding protein
MDGVAFLRSNGAQYMAKNPPKCPGFFGACNNPVDLGVARSLGTSGGNLAGVTYYVPVVSQFERYKKIFPNLKTVGLLCDKSNASAGVEIIETKSACEALKIEFVECSSSSKDELVKVVNEAKDKCDLLVIGNQATVYDNGATVALVAGKTPVMSFAEKPITQKQVLGGIVADNAKLGSMLADIVIAVVVDGKKPGEVPVGLDTEPKLYLSTKKAKELNVTVPDDVLKTAKMID